LGGQTKDMTKNTGQDWKETGGDGKGEEKKGEEQWKQ